MIQKHKQEKNLFEIFSSLETTKNIGERVKILQDNESYVLKTILQASFHPDIIFDLPAGTPPYKISEIPPGMQRMSLKKQIDILPRLLVNNNKIPKMKKEMLFIRVLEDVDPKDAEIIVAMKDKQLHKIYTLLSKSLVIKAFPTLSIGE